MSDIPQKPNKHICLTNRRPLMISSDPEGELFAALADPDVLTLVRGLSKEEARSPFTDGLFGLDEPKTNAAVKKMKSVGLISSRRDGDAHVYFLNAPRFRDLAMFLNDLVKE
ncbi:MAG: hypothetical protein MJZ68_04650 [archaeon]|nr:hypothetical protein [archaeon]